jgi:tetratricopeptide (TPR) repeat protein
LALGALLDSVANAISLLTPWVASIGTACIVLLWLLARFLLPLYPLPWVIGDQRVRVRTLGRQPTAFAVGMVLLLWIPSVVTQWRPSPPSTEVQSIVEKLVKAHQRELAGFHEREQVAQDQVKALTEAVTALTQQKGPDIANALAQLSQGNTEAAETIFETVLARKTAEGQAANQQAAEAARHLGAFAFLYDTQKALTAYRRAVELDPANAEGWNQLGALLVRIGLLDDAMDMFRKVLTLGEKTNDRQLLATAYGHLGIVYRIRGDLAQAEDMHREALKLYEALGHKEGIANAYGNLANVYQKRGDLTQAEVLYRKALEIDEALGRKGEMANQYGNLGILYQVRGDLTQAEDMHRKALDLNKALGRKGEMANQYGYLGSVYQLRGDLTQAEALHRKALEIDEALGRKGDTADQYNSLGIVYRTRGDLTQAEALHRKALKIDEALGRKGGMAIAYGNLGMVYQMRGDLGQAEGLYRKALVLFQEIGATRQKDEVQGLLRALRVQDSP